MPRGKTSAEYYADKPEEYGKLKEQVAKRKARVRTEQYMKLNTIKHEKGCKDCGEKDPVVLDFDHRNPNEKINSISRMVAMTGPWGKIEKEITKCDVVCANCHRRRTAKQQRWYTELTPG